MSRWGCGGSVLGALLGLLLVILFFLWLRLTTTPSITVQPAASAPDVTVFLSEHSLSRIASKELKKPTVIDFEPNGQMKVTTPVKVGSLEPVVDLGLALEMQGNTAVSRLHWVQLGFLRIPANWLPANIMAMGTLPGQTITQQIPPQFILVGLTTASEGLNFQLNWRK